MIRFDHTDAKAYCASLGLIWSDQMAAQADSLFVELGLSQDQATRLLCHHAWVVNWLFTPGAYHWPARLALAVHFLLGRSRPAPQIRATR